MATGPSAAMSAALGMLGLSNSTASSPPYGGGLLGSGPTLTMIELERLKSQVGRDTSPTTVIAEHCDMVFRSVRAKNGHIILASRRGSGDMSDIYIVPEGMTPGQMIDTILTTSKLDGK